MKILKVREEKENQENNAAELRFFGDLKNIHEEHICVQHNCYLVISPQLTYLVFADCCFRTS